MKEDAGNTPLLLARHINTLDEPFRELPLRLIPRLGTVALRTAGLVLPAPDLSNDLDLQPFDTILPDRTTYDVDDYYRANDLEDLLSEELIGFARHEDAEQRLRRRDLEERIDFLKAAGFIGIDTRDEVSKTIANLWALAFHGSLQRREDEANVPEMQYGAAQQLQELMYAEDWPQRKLAELEMLGFEVKNALATRRLLFSYSLGQPLRARSTIEGGKIDVDLFDSDNYLRIIRALHAQDSAVVLGEMFGLIVEETRLISPLSVPKLNAIKQARQAYEAVEEFLQDGRITESIHSVRAAYIHEGHDAFMHDLERIHIPDFVTVLSSAVFDRTKFVHQLDIGASDRIPKYALANATTALSKVIVDKNCEVYVPTSTYTEAKAYARSLTEAEMEYLVGTHEVPGKLPRPYRIFVQYARAGSSAERNAILDAENKRREIDNYRAPIDAAKLRDHYSIRALQLLQRFRENPKNPMTYTKKEIIHEMRARYNMLAPGDKLSVLESCFMAAGDKAWKRDLFEHWATNSYSYAELAELFLDSAEMEGFGEDGHDEVDTDDEAGYAIDDSEYEYDEALEEQIESDMRSNIRFIAANISRILAAEKLRAALLGAKYKTEFMID